MPSHTVPLNTEADTDTLAQRLASLMPAGLVFLQGDLGAGKTTLTRYWLRALGIQGAIKSPTYTLVEPYARACGAPIFHFDLYRLHDPDELDMLGFEDYLQQITAQGALLLIEWPSKGAGRLPSPNLEISLKQNADDTRSAVLTSNSATFTTTALDLTMARQV